MYLDDLKILLKKIERFKEGVAAPAVFWVNRLSDRWLRFETLNSTEGKILQVNFYHGHFKINIDILREAEIVNRFSNEGIIWASTYNNWLRP